MSKVYSFKFSWTTEVIGGLTIFAAMSYIVLANPLILAEAGGGGVSAPNMAAVLLATCLIAGVFSILMGGIAWSPSALACGMGLNSFFVQYATMFQIDWRVLLLLNLLCAVVVLGMSIPWGGDRSVRHGFIEDLPPALRDIVDAAIATLLASVAIELILQDQNIITGETLDDVADVRLLNVGDSIASPLGVVLVAFAALLVFDRILELAAKKLKASAGWFGRLAEGVVHFLRAAKLLFAAAGVGFVLYSAHPGAFDQLSIPSDGGLMWLTGNLPDRLTSALFDNAQISQTLIVVLSGFLAAIYFVTILFVMVFDISGTPYQMLPKSAPGDIQRQPAFQAQDWVDSREARSRRGFWLDSLANVAAPLMMTSPVSCYAENLVGSDVGPNRGEGVRTGISAIIVGAAFLLVFYFAQSDLQATSAFLAHIPRSVIAPMLLWIVMLIALDYYGKQIGAKRNDEDKAGLDWESIVASVVTIGTTLINGLAFGLCVGVLAIWLLELAGLGSRKPTGTTTGIAVLALFALLAQIAVLVGAGEMAVPTAAAPAVAPAISPAPAAP